MISTDAGMQIDFRDKQLANTSLSILASIVGDSNVTTSSDSHVPKQLEPRMVTPAGMPIDVSE
jgi:hypothetical protein